MYSIRILIVVLAVAFVGGCVTDGSFVPPYEEEKTLGGDGGGGGNY